MRILILQETDWLRRYPAQQHHLAERLSLRGHEIHVIDYEILWKMDKNRGLYSSLTIFDNIHKIHDDANIKVIRPGIIKIPWLEYVSLIFSHKKEIDREIKEFAPHVIVAMDILNAHIGLKAAKKNKIPFIYYWIDVNHELIPVKPFRPFGKIVESLTVKRADMVLTINEELSDYVIELGANPDRTFVVPAGIDTQNFNPESQNGQKIRKIYGIGENDIVIFFMGWLYHFSGLKEVVREFGKNKINNLKFLIVGEGDALRI